jgi:hypothetical protein
MKKAVQTKEMDERTEMIFSQLTPSEIVMNLSDVSFIEKTTSRCVFLSVLTGFQIGRMGRLMAYYR